MNARLLRPLFIAMRATDPLQHLLYFVRAPWPWGKPHEAAGLHRTSWQLGSRVPRGAHTQQPAMPVIGFLNSASAGPYRQLIDAFRRGLNETGFVEGRNVMIDYRWAEGQYDRLPGFAADLVRRNVAVIVATGGPPAAMAAKAAATTTPIVFISSEGRRE